MDVLKVRMLPSKRPTASMVLLEGIGGEEGSWEIGNWEIIAHPHRAFRRVIQQYYWTIYRDQKNTFLWNIFKSCFLLKLILVLYNGFHLVIPLLLSRFLTWHVVLRLKHGLE